MFDHMITHVETKQEREIIFPTYTSGFLLFFNDLNLI